MINIMHYMRPLGFLAIFISAFSWGLELANFVVECPYCQTQRTMIGLLGLLMLLPDYRYISQLLAGVFGMMGIHVACAHLFIFIRDWNVFHHFTLLASCALGIMVAQVIMLFVRAYSPTITGRNNL